MDKLRLWQWGKVTRSRPGLKNHEYFQDEPDVVEYTDYKYWIRLTPAFGWNIWGLGYYKRGAGWHRRKKI